MSNRLWSLSGSLKITRPVLVSWQGLVLPGFKAVLYTTQVLSPFTIMVRLGLKYCGTGIREQCPFRSLVMDDKKMQPGYWLGSEFCVSVIV